MVHKDLALGILIVVLSQFVLIGVSYFISREYWWTVPLVVFGSVFYWNMANVGFTLAFKGIKVHD